LDSCFDYAHRREEFSVVKSLLPNQWDSFGFNVRAVVAEVVDPRPRTGCHAGKIMYRVWKTNPIPWDERTPNEIRYLNLTLQLTQPINPVKEFKIGYNFFQ
jgi:hypothetical protein